MRWLEGDFSHRCSAWIITGCCFPSCNAWSCQARAYASYHQDTARGLIRMVPAAQLCYNAATL